MDERVVDKTRINHSEETDERYWITKEIAKVKVNDNLGEIWTYPAVHIFHGKMSADIIRDVTEYCNMTNDNSAANKLIANIEGLQDNLDVNHPLMKGYVDMMMQSACTFVDNCQMDHGGKSEKRVEIQEIWDVKMKPGDYNPMHIHGTASTEGLSSIFYLKVPHQFAKAADRGENDPKYSYSFKRDGWLKFLWGLSKYENSDHFSCATNAYILPRIGDFYIFPKSLNHMVYPFRDKEDRWSVQCNFNVWEKGEEEAYEIMKENGVLRGGLFK